MPYTPQEYQSQYSNYGGAGSDSTGWSDYYQQRWNTQHSKALGGHEGGRTGQDYGEAMLGGPVGWYEAATGKNLLGDNSPFNGTSLNVNMTEDVYNSMSQQEWAHFRKSSEKEQNDFIATRTRDLQKDSAAKAKFDAAEADKKKAADEYDKVYNERIQRQNDIMKRVQAFADEMNMPVDQLMQKDGFAQALNASTYQNTMANGNRSLGGLSQVNADLATKKALLGYQNQRMMQGQQALNQVYNMQQQQINTTEGIRQFNSGLDQYNQGLDMQMQALRAQAQAQQYQQNLQRSGQTLGMIGGVIGGIYGGAGGAQAGYSLGSGFGQMQYQQSNPYKPYQYTYPSSSRGGNGGYSGGGLGGVGGGNF